MRTSAELLRQREELDAQIRALREPVLAEVRNTIAEFGFTPEELGFAKVRRTRGKQPIMYRDGHGNVWSGFGRPPQWVKDKLAQGHPLESLRSGFPKLPHKGTA